MMALEVGTTSGVVGRGGQVSLPGRSVGALHRHRGTIWAIVDETELWAHDSDWHHVADTGGSRGNCLGFDRDGLFMGTEKAHLLRLHDEELRPDQGFETAEGRADWYTPWGGPPDVRSVAVGGDGRRFVNVHVGGILIADAGEDRWRATIDFKSDVHEVRLGAKPDQVVAASAWGLASSEDNGATWSFSNGGLHGDYLRAVAVGDEWLYVTASTGPSGGRAALYRRRLDRDGDLEKVTNGLPEWFAGNIDTGCLDASGKAVAFGVDKGDVYASEDGGDTWELIHAGLDPVRSVLLT